MKDQYFQFWLPYYTAILNIKLAVPLSPLFTVQRAQFSCMYDHEKVLPLDIHLSTVTDRTLFPLSVLTAIFVYIVAVLALVKKEEAKLMWYHCLI